MASTCMECGASFETMSELCAHDSKNHTGPSCTRPVQSLEQYYVFKTKLAERQRIERRPWNVAWRLAKWFWRLLPIHFKRDDED